jgi:4-hydroxythreonine-4-phosphate dehydrogenase
MGDINGIGPEVIVKALSRHDFTEDATFVIFGNAEFISQTGCLLGLNIINSCKYVNVELTNSRLIREYGIPTVTSGNIAYNAITGAIDSALNGTIDAIVTAPISKKAIQMAGFNFSGHTEILQSYFPDNNAQMLFVSNSIKLLLLTRHIPLMHVPEVLSEKLIVENVINLVDNLRAFYGINNPAIAILGLNPHAGESGSIGTEEQQIIIPAIEKLKAKNINIEGPFPADSFWKDAHNYDCIVAL